MAQLHIALIGLLALGGASAQVPSYTVTYTSYSESITTLLETSTTSTHCKLISGLYDVGAAAGLTTAQNTTFYTFLNDLETTVINNSSITNETVKLFYAAKVIAEFNITQPQIFALINQKNITGWSTVSNVISITNSYNLQTSLNLILSTDASGSTEFYNQVISALTVGGYTTELTAIPAVPERLRLLPGRTGVQPRPRRRLLVPAVDPVERGHHQQEPALPQHRACPDQAVLQRPRPGLRIHDDS